MDADGPVIEIFPPGSGGTRGFSAGTSNGAPLNPSPALRLDMGSTFKSPWFWVVVGIVGTVWFLEFKRKR